MNRPVRRVGLVVNPIAGIGGAAGLHGSDGAAIQRLAVQRHGRSEAASRTRRFLAVLDEEPVAVHWIVAPGIMGADYLRSPHGAITEVAITLAGSAGAGPAVTTAEDTRAAVAAMVDAGAELIVFAGGDGTARDVANATGDRVPLVGIPTGVKMQSAVFGLSPESAARAVLQWLHGTAHLSPAEIIDLDESAYRSGVLGSTIFAQATTVAAPHLVVGRKVGSATPVSVGLDDIAAAARLRLDDDAVWLLGPGTTVQDVAACWSLPSSLLGVDVVDRGTLVAADASAAQITELCRGRAVQVVLSPIGGQGFLLGRGNQQIGAALSGRITAKDLIVVATEAKLAGLSEGCLYLDTSLAGGSVSYLRVITGRRSSAVVPVVTGDGS